MTNEKAIERIKAFSVFLTGGNPIWDVDECKEAFDIAIAAMEQKWIPVSEAMPEESDGTVLVCMPNKFPYNEKEPFVNAKHNRQVETATYSQHSDTWYFKNGGVTSVRPIAWMPLPMPWRGEDDERPDAVE